MVGFIILIFFLDYFRIVERKNARLYCTNTKQYSTLYIIMNVLKHLEMFHCICTVNFSSEKTNVPKIALGQKHFLRLTTRSNRKE